MSTEMFKTPMEVAVYQLHNYSISFFSSLLGGDVVSVKLDNSASGASVVAIDNKIEQAMDLVKNHLMYAVREEVEILKEQIKELAEKNNQLERENSLLKNLASPEQLEKFQSRLPSDESLPTQNPLADRADQPSPHSPSHCSQAELDLQSHRRATSMKLAMLMKNKMITMDIPVAEPVFCLTKVSEDQSVKESAGSEGLHWDREECLFQEEEAFSLPPPPKPNEGERENVMGLVQRPDLECPERHVFRLTEPCH
uniref:TSC22 domain family protein 3 n=1 Tax=Paramormyrops kingsleyae TaxID=1676925 RepID=A0A3B3QJX4_9TELE